MTTSKNAETEAWPSAEERAHNISQAQALRDAASKGGLRFQAYLPPNLAMWLLGLIEQGDFSDPSEAVFVMLGEQQELEPHADLRDELLRRRVQSAIDDPSPGIPAEEVFEKLRARLSAPQPEPAVWKRFQKSQK